jgi:predicted transcriptional regulator
MGAMIACPYCVYTATSYKALAAHFRHAQHPDYKAWKASVQPSKVEGVDYVICLECGGSVITLRGHLKSKHGMTSAAYLAKHPNASLHSAKNIARHAAGATEGAKRRDYGGTKVIKCPACEVDHEVSKYFVPGTHNSNCPPCRLDKINRDITQSQEFVKASGIEGVDYVTCLECGHVAVHLTSHLTSTHDVTAYRAKYPNAPLSASTAGQRDKTYRIGSHHAPETIQKMRDSGGWMRGLTADTDSRIARLRDSIVEGFRNGRTTHPPTVSIPKTELQAFARPDGRIDIGKAEKHFPHCRQTIVREVVRHGLEPYTYRISQTVCLETVSKALGGASYKAEASFKEYRNPETGFPFLYDGYFVDHDLIVEFHGYQHYIFPNRYHATVDDYKRQVVRDALKRRLVETGGKHRLLEVRFDDPFDDVEWVRGRLSDLAA